MEIAEKTSAQLQQEIDQDRQRIGDRIDAIQERMSPGQLIDEVLTYAKGSGGGEYVSNLGQAIRTNPIPVALMGVSLAWLMAKQNTSVVAPAKSSSDEGDYYPLYQVEGPVRRLGPPEIEDGSRYSHFTDGTGKRIKALTDETGRRAGDFLDEAGKTYRGFADASGKQIDHVADETGALLDAATGWASQKWDSAKRSVSNIGSTVSEAASSISDRSSSAVTSLQEQTNKLNDAILVHFRDQPLVGGALAFALGAAIGAALPHTDTEDELLGEAADSTKETLNAQAADAADHGKDFAGKVYDSAVSVASEAYDTLKDGVVEESGALSERNEEKRDINS